MKSSHVFLLSNYSSLWTTCVKLIWRHINLYSFISIYLFIYFLVLWFNPFSLSIFSQLLHNYFIILSTIFFSTYANLCYALWNTLLFGISLCCIMYTAWAVFIYEICVLTQCINETSHVLKMLLMYEIKLITIMNFIMQKKRNIWERERDKRREEKSERKKVKERERLKDYLCTKVRWRGRLMDQKKTSLMMVTFF